MRKHPDFERKLILMGLPQAPNNQVAVMQS